LVSNAPATLIVSPTALAFSYTIGGPIPDPSLTSVFVLASNGSPQSATVTRHHGDLAEDLAGRPVRYDHRHGEPVRSVAKNLYRHDYHRRSGGNQQIPDPDRHAHRQRSRAQDSRDLSSRTDPRLAVIHPHPARFKLCKFNRSRHRVHARHNPYRHRLRRNARHGNGNAGYSCLCL